jgi:hypothetical protein
VKKVLPAATLLVLGGSTGVAALFRRPGAFFRPREELCNRRAPPFGRDRRLERRRQARPGDRKRRSSHGLSAPEQGRRKLPGQARLQNPSGPQDSNTVPRMRCDTLSPRLRSLPVSPFTSWPGSLGRASTRLTAPMATCCPTRSTAPGRLWTRSCPERAQRRRPRMPARTWKTPPERGFRCIGAPRFELGTSSPPD